MKIGELKQAWLVIGHASGELPPYTTLVHDKTKIETAIKEIMSTNGVIGYSVWQQVLIEE